MVSQNRYHFVARLYGQASYRLGSNLLLLQSLHISDAFYFLHRVHSLQQQRRPQAEETMKKKQGTFKPKEPMFLKYQQIRFPAKTSEYSSRYLKQPSNPKICYLPLRPAALKVYKIHVIFHLVLWSIGLSNVVAITTCGHATCFKSIIGRQTN